MPEKILISSCLVGEKCAYDGKDRLCKNISEIYELAEVVHICPEVAGGLPVPVRRPIGGF